jgi:hypothetical protein
MADASRTISNIMPEYVDRAIYALLKELCNRSGGSAKRLYPGGMR